jgi:hypothetical protein
MATVTTASDTPSALERRRRAAQRVDDFILGTPLNISLFLLALKHTGNAALFQTMRPIHVMFSASDAFVSQAPKPHFRVHSGPVPA